MSMMEFVIMLEIIFCISICILAYWFWRRLRHREEALYYICLDGHAVRSRGEWMIDATLQFLQIPHEYEPVLRIQGHTIHPDFGIGNGIYIEYWGLQTQKYLTNKRFKQTLYLNGKYHLINLENKDLYNLIHTLTLQLKPFKNFYPTLYKLLEVINL